MAWLGGEGLRAREALIGLWYWLRVMGITTSRENCVRFLKIVSALALVLVLLGVVAGLFLGAIE